MTGFTFDEREIDFVEGQTVGAALINAGIYSWRVTRRHATPRGLFCGIGVCYDCLISVNGAGNQRACLAPAAAGMTVTTQTGTGHDDLAC
ncbi:MAG TPA: (2Fe-2S)-binding protein [Jatrophihabitans sp.]|jgi:predicted molibdopterin-dependent oxidoreductase YjgC|uniref:(2Fe-2S)-binding protein n=1 Tax=Jatrophihabitans sp. TaxID=1932789 RepID=UPI002F1DBA61